MPLLRGAESRPLDHLYDNTFISGAGRSAAMVQTAPVSGYEVSGGNQLQYIRGPVMARLASVPAHTLFAGADQSSALVANEGEELEPFKKSVEVQTVFRESESQTDPYTPAYVVPKGENPEVLVLGNLTYAHGLPVGPRELYMIEHARRKRELELSLPPFTDAASLALRKKLMEQQERHEFGLREAEIDEQREQRLQEVAAALQARNDSAEFLAEQKLDALRQTRVDKRMMALEKIKTKRLKVLRNLVQQRDDSEPVLNDTVKTAVIDKYFNKTSELYAPMKRTGTLQKGATQIPSFAQTAFQDVAYMGSLEKTMTSLASKTLASDIRSASGHRTKRLNTQQKKEQSLQNDLARMFKATRQSKMSEQNSPSGSRSPSIDMMSPVATASTTNKGRPNTPDYVHSVKASAADPVAEAILLLQRLLRGRAVQNMMLDGRARKLQLIRELQYNPPPLGNASNSLPADRQQQQEEQEEQRQRREEQQRQEGAELPPPQARSNAERTVVERMVAVQTLTVDAIICSYLSRRLAELSAPRDAIATHTQEVEDAAAADKGVDAAAADKGVDAAVVNTDEKPSDVVDTGNGPSDVEFSPTEFVRDFVDSVISTVIRSIESA